MKTSRAYLTFIGLLFLLSMVVICTAQTANSTDESQQKAKTLWEQAIAAKGGRERLNAVRNLVISSSAKYMHGVRRHQIRQESLFVFPNKVWWWSDMRPDVFGLRMTMYNFDTGRKYVVQLGDPHTGLELIEGNESRESRLLGLAPLFLETEWLKPVMLETKVGKVNLKRVDIIKTTIYGERVDFTLDQKTHLPVRVSYHSTSNNKTYITDVDYSDYVEVNGIKMPQTEKYEDGPTYRRSYQFNVEYDESIFTKPPPIESGPTLWQSKRTVR